MIVIKPETIRTQDYNCAIISVDITDDGTPREIGYYVDYPHRTWGYEMYSGKGYGGDSNKGSYSRNYVKGERMPAKYALVKKWLHEKWELNFGTKHADAQRPYVEPERVGDAAIETIL